jgi:nitrogen fixation NifU-like protein
VSDTINEDKELSAVIGRHLIQPENYGKLEDANCVGVGIDQSTKSYVIMYIKRDDTHILDVMFGSNGTQDVNTLGSLFTEMIKAQEIKEAQDIALQLEQDLQELYATLPKPKIDLSKPEGQQVEHVSTEHQDAANMVLTSFRAAMRHYDRKKGGIEEDQFEMNISKACPYSGTECHFDTPQKES